MSAGMAYEAMNNAGARNERLIVILNDNDMSIAPRSARSRPIWRASPRAAPTCICATSPSNWPELPKYWERRAALAEEMTPHLLDRRHAV